MLRRYGMSLFGAYHHSSWSPSLSMFRSLWRLVRFIASLLFRFLYCPVLQGKTEVTNSMRVVMIIMESFPSFWSSIDFRHSSPTTRALPYRLAYNDDTNHDCGTQNFKGKTTYGCLLGAPLTFCCPRHPTVGSRRHLPLAAMRWYYL